jgi:hypothetical protein
VNVNEENEKKRKRGREGGFLAGVRERELMEEKEG